MFLLPLFVPLLDEHLMGIYFYCAKLIHVSAIYKLVAHTLTDLTRNDTYFKIHSFIFHINVAGSIK